MSSEKPHASAAVSEYGLRVAEAVRDACRTREGVSVVGDMAICRLDLAAIVSSVEPPDTFHDGYLAGLEHAAMLNEDELAAEIKRASGGEP